VLDLFDLDVRLTNSGRYGVNNIRELLGHKVDLNFIETNPAVRLDKD
jgi:phenylalanyl-tRNA synthetase alpha chain